MSELQLGMPTLIELEDLQANLALARRLRLSFVELNMNCPQYGPHVLPTRQLRQWEQSSGIGFTAHLPEETDLATFDPDVRAGHLACCLRAIQWAGEAGITLLNLHLRAGVYFSLPDRRVYLYERYRPQFLANLLDSFKRLLPDLQRCDVTVCLENEGLLGMPFVTEAADAVLALDSSRLGLTWDIGHDAAGDWSERPFFEARLPRVRHVHLHDARGRQNHQALFTGQVDIAGALDLARRQHTRVVIETKTVSAMEQSLAELDRRGLR